MLFIQCYSKNLRVSVTLRSTVFVNDEMSSNLAKTIMRRLLWVAYERLDNQKAKEKQKMDACLVMTSLKVLQRRELLEQWMSQI